MSGFLRRRLGIDWEIGNYAFGAAPGHPFIKAIIDNCVKAQENPSWGVQMLEGIPTPFRAQYFAPNTTGPGLVSRTLAERRELRGTVTVLFPDDVCDERTWHRFGDFGVHLMSASWRKRESFIRARLARYWETRRRKRLLRKAPATGRQSNRRLGYPRLQKLGQLDSKPRMAFAVTIRMRNRIRRDLSRRLSRRLVQTHNTEPLISFTFDDFPRSALSTGGRILEEFGAVGTYLQLIGLDGTERPHW